jgi:C-terminal processing protease CtpA/Prc
VILEPRGSQQYQGPIALLTSATTVSAAETFTLMMSSLPNVTLIGEATQGARSNKLDKLLPNGFEFSLSNEFYYDTSGNWYEGVGIPADIEVPFFTLKQRAGEQDLGLETAYSLLSAG